MASERNLVPEPAEINETESNENGSELRSNGIWNHFFEVMKNPRELDMAVWLSILAFFGSFLYAKTEEQTYKYFQIPLNYIDNPIYNMSSVLEKLVLGGLPIVILVIGVFGSIEGRKKVRTNERYSVQLDKKEHPQLTWKEIGGGVLSFFWIAFFLFAIFFYGIRTENSLIQVMATMAIMGMVILIIAYLVSWIFKSQRYTIRSDRFVEKGILYYILITGCVALYFFMSGIFIIQNGLDTVVAVVTDKNETHYKIQFAEKNGESIWKEATWVDDKIELSKEFEVLTLSEGTKLYRVNLTESDGSYQFNGNEDLINAMKENTK